MYRFCFQNNSVVASITLAILYHLTRLWFPNTFDMAIYREIEWEMAKRIFLQLFSQI